MEILLRCIEKLKNQNFNAKHTEFHNHFCVLKAETDPSTMNKEPIKLNKKHNG